jgi:aryl sulfotransferase
MSATPEPRRRIFTDSVSDSARWDALAPRAGDIVVSTPPKSGTTWTQGILAMLIAGDPEVDAQTSMKSPWIDINIRDLGEVRRRVSSCSDIPPEADQRPFMLGEVLDRR